MLEFLNDHQLMWWLGMWGIGVILILSGAYTIKAAIEGSFVGAAYFAFLTAINFHSFSRMLGTGVEKGYVGFLL